MPNKKIILFFLPWDYYGKPDFGWQVLFLFPNFCYSKKHDFHQYCFYISLICIYHCSILLQTPLHMCEIFPYEREEIDRCLHTIFVQPHARIPTFSSTIQSWSFFSLLVVTFNSILSSLPTVALQPLNYFKNDRWNASF